jgi:tight adherence protein C
VSAFLPILLAFASAACAAAGLVLLAPAPGARRGAEPGARGEAEPGARRGASQPGLRRGAQPGARPPAVAGVRVLRLLAAAGRRLRGGLSQTGAADLQARILAAGRPAGLGVREVMAAKLASAAGGGALGTLLGSIAPGRLGFVLALGTPVAGFLAPDLWLRKLAAERARRVRRELPVLLDLLRVTIEAGCSLAEALRSVGERADGSLAEEFRVVGREVALGVPLVRALEGLTVRVPLPEVRTLVAALDRARRHGAPLAEALSAQARDARFALARRIREEAARAGPKIQLVVALLLVPSVLLLVAAALTSALLGGGAEVVPL